MFIDNDNDDEFSHERSLTSDLTGAGSRDHSHSMNNNNPNNPSGQLGSGSGLVASKMARTALALVETTTTQLQNTHNTHNTHNTQNSDSSSGREQERKRDNLCASFVPKCLSKVPMRMIST